VTATAGLKDTLKKLLSLPGTKPPQFLSCPVIPTEQSLFHCTVMCLINITQSLCAINCTQNGQWQKSAVQKERWQRKTVYYITRTYLALSFPFLYQAVSCHLCFLIFQGLQLLVMKNGTPTAFQDTLRPVFKIARYNNCCYTTCTLKKNS